MSRSEDRSAAEVHSGLAGRDDLDADDIHVRVVSMPCCELFRAQPQSARDALLSPGMPKVAVEAVAPTGWHEFADVMVGLRRSGASAPGPVVYRELGFTPENVADHVRRLVQS